MSIHLGKLLGHNYEPLNRIDRQYCPIIGRVSMNITVIDVSSIKNVFIGQEVVVYSSNKADKNSIENAVKLAKIISYDLLAHLAASTKRILI